MLCYIDTSALVPLCATEATSQAVLNWYRASTDDVVSSIWCVTEFASAMGIKQRTGQITAMDARAAWQRFERLCANDLHLLPADPPLFQQAAVMAMNAVSGLRAGDALHLATAVAAGAHSTLTLDKVFAKNANDMKLVVIKI